MANRSLKLEPHAGYAEIPLDEYAAKIKDCIKNFKDTLLRVKNHEPKSWQNTIQPLEEAEEEFDHIWNLLEHINSVANTPEVREVYDHLLPIVTNFHTDLAQDVDLYKIFQHLKASSEYANLSKAQQTIIDHELRDFKLSGVDLPTAERHKIKVLSEQLSELESKFEYNVLDATEGWTYHVKPVQKKLLEGLPEHIIVAAQQKAQSLTLDGWVLSLNLPCYIAIMNYAHDRQLREEFYVAYTTRASDQGPMAGKWDNTPIIAQILHLRQQIAGLIGYENYAEYALVPRMAKKAVQVSEFLQDLLAKVKPQAEREIQELREFAKAQGFAQTLASWDIAYYSELLRKTKYDLNEEELRQYFPLRTVLEALFKTVHKIYNIHVTEVHEFTSWNDHVRLFKITDQHGKLRGHFYIDLYTREGKQGGAGVADCLGRILFADGNLQTPFVYLNCNFSPPLPGGDSTLLHDEVVTLFHEFGHTLHDLLTQVDFYSVSGMRGVEWDAVELPSQFMENWAWEYDVIGAHLPRQVFDNMLAAKNFHAGLHLLRQIEFAMFDLHVHQQVGFGNKLTAHDVIKQVRSQVAVFPVPEFNRFENDFMHVFSGGYSAGYYSYLWAEVLSCDAFAKFKTAGIFNPQLGHDFMSKILEQGGSRPAMELFVDFAGREPNIDALLRHHGIV